MRYCGHAGPPSGRYVRSTGPVISTYMYRSVTAARWSVTARHTESYTYCDETVGIARRRQPTAGGHGIEATP